MRTEHPLHGGGRTSRVADRVAVDLANRHHANTNRDGSCTTNRCRLQFSGGGSGGKKTTYINLVGIVYTCPTLTKSPLFTALWYM